MPLPGENMVESMMDNLWSTLQVDQHPSSLGITVLLIGSMGCRLDHGALGKADFVVSWDRRWTGERKTGFYSDLHKWAAGIYQRVMTLGTIGRKCSPNWLKQTQKM